MLLPYSSHLHIAGAQGIDDEGLSLADAPELSSLLKNTLPSLPPSTSYILETWQGHLSNGQGFFEEIAYLTSLFQ